VNDDEAPANAVNAPWHKHYDNPNGPIEDAQNYIANHFKINI
jgi:molecular chaperone HtpG